VQEREKCRGGGRLSRQIESVAVDPVAARVVWIEREHDGFASQCGADCFERGEYARVPYEFFRVEATALQAILRGVPTTILRSCAGVELVESGLALAAQEGDLARLLFSEVGRSLDFGPIR